MRWRLKAAGDLEGSDIGRDPRRQHCGASAAADILAMATAQAKAVPRVNHDLMTPGQSCMVASVMPSRVALGSTFPGPNLAAREANRMRAYARPLPAGTTQSGG